MNGKLAFRWLAAIFVGVLAAGGLEAQERPAAPDAAITAQVQTVMKRDPRLGTMDIEVATRAGVVSLSGFVRSLEDISKAEGVARGVRGVSDVRNHLRIANRPSQA